MLEGRGAVKAAGTTGTRPGAWWEGSKQLVRPVVAEVAPAPGTLPSLAEALAAVPEHRRPQGFKAHQPPYPLGSMLLLLLVGVLCGRRGYQSIADWARGCAQEYPEVLDALGLEAGRSPRTPSGRTVFRFVRDMRARAFQQALQGWLVSTATALRLTLSRSEQRQVPEDQISIEGKTVRGAAARRADAAEGGLHLVSADAPALVAVLDQLETAGKGQERAAAQLLLGTLSLKGRLVTADALHTQREFCQTVLDGAGDYLVPVKENQPTLLADLEAAFSPSAAEPGGERVGVEWCATRGAPAADAPRCASRHRAREQSEDAPRTLGAANPLGGGVG